MSGKVAIVGGGAAGMAAALSALQAGAEVTLFEKGSALGGILNQCIHNGFGLSYFKEELTGPEFAERLADKVRDSAIDVRLDTAILSIGKDLSIAYESPKGSGTLRADAIVYTAGSLERSAGAIALPGDRPSGILTAGQAQLYLNHYGYLPGKKIFILGSGDIGLIMARRLTLEGAKVLGVAELCPYPNGLNRNIVQCLEDYGIPLYLSQTVTRAYGKGRLTAIELSEVGPDRKPIPGTGRRIECDTLVLSIGLLPLLSLLRPLGLRKNLAGQIEVDDSLMSSLPGLFMAGNALHVHDLVDNVALEAETAGREAARMALGERASGGRELISKAGDGIGYLIPGRIRENGEEEVRFRFRVRVPNKDCFLVFSQGDKILKKIKKMSIIPSEMEFVKIPKKLLDFSQKTTIEVKLCH